MLSVPEDTTIILDGSSGELRIDPPPELLEEFRRRAASSPSAGLFDGVRGARASEPYPDTTRSSAAAMCRCPATSYPYADENQEKLLHAQQIPNTAKPNPTRPAVR